MSYIERLQIGEVSNKNSTSALLKANGVFTGKWEDVSNYNSVIIGIKVDKNSATDGLSIQWSSNGTTMCDSDSYTILANIGKVFTFTPARKYIRVVYTNGTVDLTSCGIQTIYKQGGIKASSHRINDAIVAEDDAELVKSVLTGMNDKGYFDNAKMSNKGNLKVSLDEYGDTPSIDPFDRLRVSTPYTIFDSKQLHDSQPLFWDEETSAGPSTHIAVDACTRMAVSATPGEYAVRQTKQRFNYQPGKGSLILLTYYGEQVDGIRKRLGIFDGTSADYLIPNNGIFFETDGTLSWNICKNGTITESVSQSNWNVDKLDGTGVSGVTYNANSAQIALIDFEWLGVGRVRVGFVIDGIIRYVHYFNHANDTSFDSVYMSTPNLPLRYSIENLTGEYDDTFDHICSTVISEGGLEETGILRSIDNGSTHLNADVVGTTYALLGIKLKALYNDITVTPKKISLLSLTNDGFKWSLKLNPVVAGTFTYSDLTYSAVQYAIGVTANTVTGGLDISSGYVSVASGVTEDLTTALRMGSTISGSIDSLVLCVTPLSANADILGSLTFRELL